MSILIRIVDVRSSLFWLPARTCTAYTVAVSSKNSKRRPIDLKTPENASHRPPSARTQAIGSWVQLREGSAPIARLMEKNTSPPARQDQPIPPSPSLFL